MKSEVEVRKRGVVGVGEVLEGTQEVSPEMRRAMAVVAVERFEVFVSYVMKDEEKGENVTPSRSQREWYELMDRYPRLVMWGHIESGKCLGRGTGVMKYDGEVVAVEEIREGDLLMGPDSRPRRVVSTTRGVGPLYEIVPRKGGSWVCNEVHVLTLVHTETGGVIDIGLDEYLRKSGWWKSNYKLFQPKGVEFVERDAPRVDPYFLGVWYGDGRKNLRSIEISKPDGEIERCCRDVAEGWGLEVTVSKEEGKCPIYRIVTPKRTGENPLLSAMREEVGSGERVPDSCLYGSFEVRRQFLAGILDTDGYFSNGGCEIVQKRREYAEGICFVARSLGLRAVMTAKVVNGVEYHRVSLLGDKTILPMRIARKQPKKRHKDAVDATRTGFSVKAKGEGEYFGFTLDGDGRFLLGDFTVTHNTVTLVARILWELGRNPAHRIAVVSSTYEQAEKVVRAVSKYITTSKELREVFPKLVPSKKKSDPWTQGKLTVERDMISRDPSVAAYGYRGSVLGARLSLVFIDDILDFENTYSNHQRNAVSSWVTGTIFGRLLAEARIVITGNAWSVDDLMHRLSKQPGWCAARFAVLDRKGRSTWETQWPMKRIEEQRGLLGPTEFARQMMCIVRDEKSSRFQTDWIEKCAKRGQGKRLRTEVGLIPEGCYVVTGVDLGVKQKKSSDYTSMFTILLHPNQDREVLSIYTDRIKGPRIMAAIKEIHARFGGVFIVEDNGAQDYIRQFTVEETAIPIIPMTASRKNYHPVFGIESLAIEMFNEKWIIPCHRAGVYEPEVHAWVSDLFYFDPNEHPGDRLMASFYAKEGCLRFGPLLGDKRLNGGKKPGGSGSSGGGSKLRVLG